MLGLIQRYKPVIDLLKKEGSKLKILDVGGGNASISAFVRKENFDITSADVKFRGKKKVKTVKASADNLPFRDKSFDVVISIDMLEHIPPSKRAKAVSEMMRVASKKVIIACPCSKKSEKYEKKLINFAKLFGKKLPWLEEHKKNGLPEENEIINALGKRDIKIIKNNNLIWWFLLNFFDFATNPLQKLIGEKAIFALYGPISRLFNFGKCYGRIFVVEK